MLLVMLLTVLILFEIMCWQLITSNTCITLVYLKYSNITDLSLTYKLYSF